MRATKIKGKDYIEVNERLKYFRENYPDHKLTSDIIVELSTGDRVVMKSCVIDKDGVVVATGHAYEKEGSTFINKTSYIENCETSAWGRALGNFGIGIDTAVASAEEVQNAINNQGNGNRMTIDQKTQLSDILVDAGLESSPDNKRKLAEKYGITSKTTQKEAETIIAEITKDFSEGKKL